MNRRELLLAALTGGTSAAALANTTATTATAATAATTSGIVVIGNAGVPRIDAATVQRLYTGRAIEADGTPVQVINLPAGHTLRLRFLSAYLQTDDERYRAYWTVRRHVGKGIPPREIDNPADVIEYVSKTPGAVGYIDAAMLRTGINVICRG
jgi:hypothetical protein